MAENTKYIDALKGKHIPILTLDNKWHLLFGEEGVPDEAQELADEVNDLLALQSRLREKTKEVKRLKKKLLEEIIPLRQRMMADGEGGAAETMLNKHTQLINECNEKIDELEEQQIGLPQKIYDANYELMLKTMETCYVQMHVNTEDIKEINDWIRETRVELKKQIVHKQESEVENYNIYSYMHQIFGPEVIDLFDMQYDPDRWKPKLEPE